MPSVAVHDRPGETLRKRSTVLDPRLATRLGLDYLTGFGYVWGHG